jgi:hypothetical protein
MNTQLLMAFWVAIFAAYAIVVLMRWNLGRREDDHLHFGDSEQQLVVAQSNIAHKLDVLDRWKTALLILTIVAGVIIAALHIYFSWHATTSTVVVN